MKTIRWGIIGCGDVCEVKSGPGFQKAEHSALVAVMRRDPAKAADYARRHNVPRWYTDAAALVGDPEVDAVYIATPPGNHLEYTRMAASAGKPVYVEKPMACSHAECLEMIQICEQAGTPLFVAYYRRALPRFLAIQQALQANKIGKPMQVNLTFLRPLTENEAKGILPWRLQPDASGGGHFRDMGSHALDFLDFLFGPIVSASGYTTNHAGAYSPEDTVSGCFTFSNGVSGTGTWCFAAGVREDRVDLIGSAGKLSFSVFGTEPPVLTTHTTTESLNASTPPHVHQPLIQSIVNNLISGTPTPSTGISGARTNWVMEQIEKSPPPHDQFPPVY